MRCPVMSARCPVTLGSDNVSAEALVRVGVEKAAAELGKSERQVRRWKAAGAPFGADGLIDLDELRAWLGRRARKEPGRPSEVERLATSDSVAAVSAIARAMTPPGAGELEPIEGDGEPVVVGERDREVIEALIAGDANRLIQLTAGTDLTRLLKRLNALGRTRHALAEAQRRDLENRARAAELVAVDEVKRLWAWQIEIVKTTFDALPGKLAPLAVGKAEAEIYALLDAELRDTLEAFASARPIPEPPKGAAP